MMGAEESATNIYAEVKLEADSTVSNTFIICSYCMFYIHYLDHQNME